MVSKTRNHLLHLGKIEIDQHHLIAPTRGNAGQNLITFIKEIDINMNRPFKKLRKSSMITIQSR